MATLAFTPVEEYLHTSYEPDADYVDGVVEERHLGEYDHSTWQHALTVYFAQHRTEWNVHVRIELRIQVSATRFRVADAVVFDRSRPKERFLTYPPIAVFEVLSPEDRISRILPKLEDYARMSIRNVFLIDLNDVFLRFREGRLEPLEHNREPLHGSEAFLDLSALDELRNS
jgi:Uma2 family endonuclease